MEEISRPMKTISSSTEQVMSIMPTAPKRTRAKYSPAWVTSGPVEVVERAEQRDEDDGGDEEMEEDGEGVDLDGAVEGGDGAVASMSGAGTRLATPAASGAEDGEPAEGLAGVAGGEEGLGQHDEDAGDGEDEFGEEGEDVGGH